MPVEHAVSKSQAASVCRFAILRKPRSLPDAWIEAIARIELLIERRERGLRVDMLVVLPEGQRLNRRRVDLADLAGDPFIIFPRTIGPDLYDSLIGPCHATGFAPSISMESPQISSAANLVSAGFGVAVVPSSMRQVQVEGVSYHELQGKPLATGIALIHRQREGSPAVTNFVRIVRQYRAAARRSSGQ
ncbi:LysR substrate binding domain-containing protein [Paraburkholderia steynii]|uniref:LysR substrate binding domain-containing protein n=1 Tax=Paraburkholderia steynii TaxID=1245441 RepID=A0A7Z7FJB4_9BURK|nr:LysR substrate binding domain-containing protein [Paraburkholderia steynii]